MRFHHEPYADTERQFTDMRELIVESYTQAGWRYNWLVSRFEDWKYGGNSLRVKADPDFFKNIAHLWRDDRGKLAGFAVSEYGDEKIWAQVHPAYADIEAVMLSWIAEIWSAGREQIATYAYTTDETRQRLLRDRGFAYDADVAFVREYDLRRSSIDVRLHPDFRIERLSRNRDYDGMVHAVNAAFARPKKLTRDWLNSKLFSAPSMSEDWVFAAVTAAGHIASFGFVWIDAVNQIAEIDPIGTCPEFQKRGLAKAVITACFRALQEAGITTAYITSGPEPLPSNRLYDALDPVAKWQEQRWVRKTEK